MKKKILSLVLAAALLAGATTSVMAASGDTVEDPTKTFVDSPSLTPDVKSDNEEIEVVTDNVVTGGYIRQKGLSEPRALEQIDYPVIKITTLNMSSRANSAVDSANPGASSDQKAGMMTESGLNYGKNASVNETADQYYRAESTGEFVDNYDLSFFDNLVAVAEDQLNDYSVIQIADISANTQAISSGKSVRLTFSAPGVKTGSRVMVGRIRNGSMEFVPATAGNGTISFDVYPGNLGTFVLMTCRQ